MLSVIIPAYNEETKVEKDASDFMNNTHLTFLAILKSSLLGEKAKLDNDISPAEWQQMFAMAGIHSVLPLFYEAVYDSPALKAALAEAQQSATQQSTSQPSDKPQPSSLPALAKRQVMQQVMKQTMRTSEFLGLNRELQAAGIRPLVVKGIICRNLYPKPDSRPSGDEDVLIPAEQFETCHQVMVKFGMQTAADEQEMRAAYEVPYRKVGSRLYIELHKSLFPPQSEAYGDMNRFFEGVFDRTIVEEVQGEKIWTLGYTDHLFYLICHAFKHFLHSGFGIRQVCDIVLYANRYGCEVDWEQVLEHCREINADKFAAALFQIGSKFLVFDPDKARYPDSWRCIVVDEQAMLEDLLNGGLYGDASMSRKHSSNITLDAVAAEKQGKKAGNSVLLSVFPPREALESRYPYLKKHPYLLPAAWVSRLWKYSKETQNGANNNAAEALKIGNERVELLRQYGIIK